MSASLEQPNTNPGPAEGEGAVIETVDVSKLFGAVRAVDELSLRIPRKGMTSIVGPQRVGQVDAGEPADRGAAAGRRHGHHRRHRPAGGQGLREPGALLTRTFQEVRLFEQITVWDNIMVVLTARGLFPALLERVRPSQRQKAQQILETVGLWEKRGDLAMNLSYGQRKLLEIGRAMALDVNTYLFDEPFAGLFPRMLERVMSILKQMREDGYTIIFVSHNMDIVRDMSDHLIVLDSGTLLGEGEADEVLSREEVIEAYLGA